MHKIDTEKIKNLYEVFSELDEDFQNHAIGYMHDLLVKQNAKREVLERAEGKKDVFTEKLLKSVTDEMREDMLLIIQSMSGMSKEQQAHVAIVMEELLPGTITKIEEISVVINTKRISMEEYFKLHFPGVDYESVRKDALKVLEQV